eukprot:403367385
METVGNKTDLYMNADEETKVQQNGNLAADSQQIVDDTDQSLDKDGIEGGVEKKQKSPETMERIQKLMLAIKAMTAIKLTRDDNVAAEIVQGVFLGSVGCAFHPESLKRHKITHILTCADKIQPRFPDDYKYMCIPISDTPSENIAKYFRQAYYFINDALSQNEDLPEDKQNNVLIHCFAGKSRSTSFLLAYIMAKNQTTLKDGVELVRSKRPIACPNPGFMLQLKLYEKSLFGTNSDIPVILDKKQKQSVEDSKNQDLTVDQVQTNDSDNNGVQNSLIKEVQDGIQQIQMSGDEEGASELTEKILRIQLDPNNDN